jgi:hypothetical protein
VPYPVADPYRQAIRNSIPIQYVVEASRSGVVLPGAASLAPVGGRITDTIKPGVRRNLTLDLAPSPGLFDLLAPTGTTLGVQAVITYTNRSVVTIPMGVFDVDSENMVEGDDGSVSLTAPDKWVKIQRARFLWPTGPQVGIAVTQQIAYLIRDALGPTEPVNITATSTATVGPLTWEKDRAQAINDLAGAIGAWVYFDRSGTATIADIPSIGASADWLTDASASGVLTSLKRSRDRSKTCNVVVVTSTASDGEAFPTQYVWDNDPYSPTYAGTDPPSAADAGPFGIVPYFYDTPLPLTVDQARAAGYTILARTTGLASQASAGQVPNPAVDAFDIFDVLPPEERYDIPRVLERHIADTVTHPLVVGPEQQIDMRSTRTDPYS